jgi:DNA polymerase I
MPSLATPAEVKALIRGAKLLAIDLETTGLNPRRDRVRLLSITDGKTPLVLDCFEHDLRPILPELAGKILVAHNATFDLGFLYHVGLRDIPETVCTYLMGHVATAGLGGGDHGFPRLGLGDCARRWLNRELPKDLQTSSWNGPLSADQIEYARRDAIILIPLFHAIQQGKEGLNAAKLNQAMAIECDALRAFVWMSQTGVQFDASKWKANAERTTVELAEVMKKLEESAPKRQKSGAFLFEDMHVWNWDSPAHMQELFERLGFKVESTADAQLAHINHPVAGLLRKHRELSKQLSTYGFDWLKYVEPDGRVYANWRQIGAASGRTSCKLPNLQQIPRDKTRRECFVAPENRCLVKCDYSALQMRIAARWADDKALKKVFHWGSDPHTATAQALLGKKEVSKRDRQIAKSANFLLIFGGSAAGLSIYAKTNFGVDMPLEEAEKHRNKFFENYWGLARWHSNAASSDYPETRSKIGRRRLLPPHCSMTWKLNTPVQADEADGAKKAMGLLWRRRAEHPSARPVIFNHDEIVLECDDSAAEAVKEWLEEAMMDGMESILDPVPCKVDSSIVKTWGG